jgi:hypothetical protein
VARWRPLVGWAGQCATYIGCAVAPLSIMAWWLQRRSPTVLRTTQRDLPMRVSLEPMALARQRRISISNTQAFVSALTYAAITAAGHQ